MCTMIGQFSVIFHFIFFSEGTVMNLAIYLVLSTHIIFLSLSMGNGKAFMEMWSASLLSLPFFIKISHSSSWAVFLSKDVGHYLKPINNLLIFSFLPLKSLWLAEKHWFRNECV